MKKSLTIVSLSLIVLSLVGIAVAYLPAEPANGHGAPLFESFPVNQSRTINFSADEEEESTGDSPSEKDRERRRLDQLRDWCLLTVISASGLPPKEVAETVYDLPAVRQEHLRRVANFEYGVTRSRVIRDGTVVALIPAGPDTPQASATRRDNLAHIADEQRKNLGDVPAELVVFEYELLRDENAARLTRRDSIPGKDLFTPLYGYNERAVRGLQDLRAFLEETDELTYAHKSPDGLRLGGRKRLRETESGELPYGRIGVEEVAAIWRGQQGLKEFQGCGFSLDPRLDMQKMAGTFNAEVAPYLGRVSPILTTRAREILARTPGTPDEARLNEFEFALTLSEVCEKAPDRNVCRELMHQLIWQHSYQTARYEGRHLAGTEAGMVLFYTDLLMKLWSFDLAESSPSHNRIPDFPVKAKMRFATTHKSEFDRAPATRLWLGPLNAGFQVADERRSLVFAHNATRLFAHPTDMLTGTDNQDLAEPNIYNRTFINWWNDHYEEIARYEPQYERLNGIVKWSIVISWLEEGEQQKLLGYLADDAPDAVRVTRTNYFTEWKDRHPELRFARWDKLSFDKQADARGENESLDIVKSEFFPAFGEKIRWEGGVSLASRSAVEEAALASEELELLAPAARRAGVDVVRSDLAAGRLRTVDATEFNFKNFSEEAVSTLAKPKPSARLTNAYGELENVGFDRTIRSTSESFLMRTRAEGSRVLGDVGELRIVKHPDGFRVSWEPREIDLGQTLARRISDANADAAVTKLVSHPEVESVLIKDGGKAYMVKIRDAEGWVKLAPAESDGASIAEGFQSRVAGIGDKSKPIDVAWLENEAVETELRGNGYLQFNPATKGRAGVTMECCGRAPPPGAREFYVERGGMKVRAFVDDAERIYVRTEDIPVGLRSDPVQLVRSGLSQEDLHVARNLEGGQYRELADELVRDPVSFQNSLNRILTEGLERNNELVARQQYSEALAHTRQMIEMHGPVPELTYREALLEASTENVERASASLNNSLPRPMQDAEKFLTEVDVRLQNAASAQERLNIRRVGDFAEWKGYKAKSGEIISFTRDKTLHLELRATSLPKGQSVGAEELRAAISRGDPVYVPDTPGFANVEVYTPQGGNSLHQLISLRRVEVTRVPLADVSHYQPTLVRELGTNTTWRLTNSWVSNAAPQYLRLRPDDDCDTPEKRCYVYVVTPAPDDGP